MASPTIDQLIINSPYEEPTGHWAYDPALRVFERTEGRRPAGFIRASTASKSFDDPGIFTPLELPNQIRPRVKAWREAGYPGVTGITKRLLAHWYDAEQRSDRRFFFCQLEAIEGSDPDRRLLERVLPHLTRTRLRRHPPGVMAFVVDHHEAVR